MGELNIGVSLSLTDKSLRELQGKLTRAVNNISPEITLDIDQRRLAKLITGQLPKGPKLDIDVELPAAQKRQLRDSLKELVERQQIKEIGFSAGLLRRLKAQLEKALEAKVNAEIQLAEEGPGVDPKVRQALNQVIEVQEGRINKSLDALVVATERRVKFQNEVNAETQRVFNSLTGLRKQVFAQEVSEEKRAQIIDNLSAVQNAILKNEQTSSAQRKAAAAQLVEREKQLASEAQLLLSQNQNLRALTVPYERTLAETAAKQRQILAAKQRQVADEERIAGQVQRVLRRPLPEASRTGPLNIEEENLRKAQQKAAAIAEGAVVDRKKIAEAIKERARVEEILRSIAISSEAPLSESLSAELRLTQVNQAKEAASARAARAEIDIANAIAARSRVEERLAQKAANLIDLTDKTGQYEQALAAAKRRQVTLERGFVASDVEIQAAINQRARDENILADYVRSQLSISQLSTQDELAYNAALKRALDNQGQIQSSSRQIVAAKRQQARDEQALADLIRGRLAISDLPAGGPGGGPPVRGSTIEASKRDQEIKKDITDTLEVRKRLADEQVRVDREYTQRIGELNRQSFDLDKKRIEAKARQFEAEQRATGDILVGLTFEQRLTEAKRQVAQRELEYNDRNRTASAQVLSAKAEVAGLEAALKAQAQQRLADDKDFTAKKRRINQQAIDKLRYISQTTSEQFGRPSFQAGPRNAPEQPARDLAAETEAINREIQQALAKRLAAEIGISNVTDQQLREYGILSSTLRQLIIAEQKKLDSANTDEVKKATANQKRINTELRRQSAAINKHTNQILKAVGISTRIPSTISEYNDALKARVRAAAAEGGLPGFSDVDQVDVGGEVSNVNKEIIALRRRIIRFREQFNKAKSAQSRFTENLRDASQQYMAARDAGASQRKINTALNRMRTAVNNLEGTRRRIASATAQEYLLQQEVNQKLRERARLTGQARRGGAAGGGGNTVTFRGARDIQAFGETLNPQQLQKFTQALFNTASAGQSASMAMKSYAGDIAAARGTVDPLNLSLKAATASAFEFGRRAAYAGKRLLEWATPAAFLFRAIGLIREATTTIIELDTQARRLEFFRADKGVFARFAEGAESYSRVINQTGLNIKTFLDISRQQGIAVKDIADALLTTARVGQQVFDAQSAVSDSSERMLGGFAQTVIELVRLENGALSAEQAVRKLNAIQNQFFARLESFDPGAGAAAIQNVGDIIAAVSAQTSFSASELANAASRVGAAFADIQGGSFVITLNAIGIAARATGAEVGRLATGFRQLGTLAVRNAKKIEELTAGRPGGPVQIIDPDTGRQTFSGLIDALKEVQRLSKIDTGKADELLKLISERRNVGDIRALAAAVEDLEEKFGDLSSSEAEALLAGEAAANSYLVQQSLTNSLQGSLASLRSEFDGLIASLGASDLFSGAINAASSLLSGLSELVNVGKALPSIINALVGVAAIKLVPKLAAGVAGFLATSVSRITGSAAQAEVQSLLNRQQTAIQGINQAQQQGFLSVKQANAARAESLRLLQQKLVLEEKIAVIDYQIAAEKQQVASNEKLINKLTRERAALAQQAASAVRSEAAARATVSSQITKSNRFLNTNLISSVGFAAVAAGSIFAEGIGKSIGGKDKALGKAVSSSITSGLTSAAVGAQIGSLIAPGIGTAIGAGVGLVAGGAYGFYDTLSEKEKKLSEEAKQRETARKKRLEAIARQRRVINARAARELALAGEYSVQQQRILNLRHELERARLRVQEAERGSKEQAQALERATTLRVKLENEKKSLIKEQKDIEVRKVALASRLSELRREEAEELQRISLLSASVTQGLTSRQAAEVSLKFDQRKIQVQLAAVRKQIEEELQEQQNIDVKIDSKEYEASRKKILDLEAKERKLALQSELQIVQARRKIVELASQEANKQVGAWEKASKKVVSAFRKAVDAQFNVAKAILSAGKLSGDILEDRGKRVISLLEAQGVTGEARLQAVISNANVQLRELRKTSRLAGQELGRTGVTAFASADDIRKSIQKVVSVINAAADRAEQEVFNRESAIVDFDLAQLRQREAQERALFELRRKQSLQEISLREGILKQEIANLKVVQDAQLRALNERIDRQRELGRLILRGPEEFSKAVKDISTAQTFFKGITDINIDSLKALIDRASTQRDIGNIEALQSVSRGLESAIKTGKAQIVSGVENKTLQRIFEQALTSGLEGGTSAEQIIDQLKKQDEFLRQRDAIQKAIEKRQGELLRLAKERVNIAKAAATVAREDFNSSKKHQDALLKSANKRLEELKRIREIWVAARDRGITIARSSITALKGAIVGDTRPRQGGIILSGRSASNLGRTIVRETSRAGGQPTTIRRVTGIGAAAPATRETETEIVNKARAAAARTAARNKGEKEAAAIERATVGEQFMKNILRLASERYKREFDAALKSENPAEAQKEAARRYRLALRNFKAVDVSDAIFVTAKRQFERALEQSGGRLDIQLAAFDDLLQGFKGYGDDFERQRILFTRYRRRVERAQEELAKAEEKAAKDPGNKALQKSVDDAARNLKRASSRITDEMRKEFTYRSRVRGVITREFDERKKAIVSAREKEIERIQAQTRTRPESFTPQRTQEGFDQIIRALQARQRAVKEAEGLTGFGRFEKDIAREYSSGDEALIKAVLDDAKKRNDGLSQSIIRSLTQVGYDLELDFKYPGNELAKRLGDSIISFRELKKANAESAAAVDARNAKLRRLDAREGRTLSRETARALIAGKAANAQNALRATAEQLNRQLISFGLSTRDAKTATRAFIQSFKIAGKNLEGFKPGDVAKALKQEGISPGAIPGIRRQNIGGIAQQGTDLRKTLESIGQRVTFGAGGRFRVEGFETAALQAQLRQQGERGIAPTGAQRRQLRRLQQRDVRRSSGNIGGVVRELFRDREVVNDFRSGFKGLLTNADFIGDLSVITGARTRRGRTRTRGRAAQELSVDALRQLLGDAGLSAVAESISTRGQAADVANLLFELKESLAKNDRESRRRTEEILRKFAEIELKAARAEKRGRIGERAITEKPFEEGEIDVRGGTGGTQDARDRARIAELYQEIVKENKKNVDSMKQAQKDNQIALSALFDAFGKKLDSIKVQTEDVRFNIRFSTEGGASPENFALLLADQMRRQGVVLDEDTMNIVVQQIIDNSQALFERGLIGIPLINKKEITDLKKKR